MTTLTLLAAIGLTPLPWQQGESLHYQVTLGTTLKGTVSRIAGDEDQDNIWIITTVSVFPLLSERIEQLYERASGRVLAQRRNGLDEVPVNLELISDVAVERIKVPAGRFDAKFVIVSGDVRAWLDPGSTALDGLLRTTIATPLGEAIIELVSWSHP